MTDDRKYDSFLSFDALLLSEKQEYNVYGKGVHFKKIHVTGLLHLKLVISTLKIKNIEVDISDIETITNLKYRSKIILIMQLIIK